MKKDKVIPKMVSVREDQHERLVKLSVTEGRSIRSILDRMLDMYEASSNK